MAYTTIKDPSAYFQIATYTGNANFNTITNDGNSDLGPDLIWGKCRTTTKTHYWYDSTRGVEKRIESDNTGAEDSSTNGVLNFYTDGFRLASGNTENDTGETYVAWQWKCNGGTTASNTDGDINSTVQVNQTAGFSIVTYTGNGSTSDQTIGHGLGVRANAVILKNRDSAVNWVVWSEGVDANHTLELNTTDSISDSTQGRVLSNAGSRGTSTIFSIRSGSGSVVQTNTSGEDYVAYCFAEKQGYSKFGTYIGNASADGPFVFTGFKPAWVLVKNSVHSGWDWAIMDNKRTPTNANGTYEWIWANLTAAEFTDGDSGINMEIDFLSNGFKIRTARDELNRNSDKFIYMCFAENPFVAGGVPTTAR
jgi:hypothetical protein